MVLKIFTNIYVARQRWQEKWLKTLPIVENSYVEKMIETTQAFFKTILDSMQYWSSRRKDVFAMMRQLGKPTAFMTLSADKINWTNLLAILHTRSPIIPFKESDEQKLFVQLNIHQRVQLVAEDPLICCIYFHRSLMKLMTMCKCKKPQTSLDDIT